MDKSIRELADQYGMSKQAMQYHVKKLPKVCTYFSTKNGSKILLVKEEGQDLLYSWLAKKNTEDVAKLYTKEEYLELQHKLEMKELENKGYLEKIKLLQQRVEEDKQRIDITLQLLDQAQQLQAMAENKIKMLEQKEKETEQTVQPEEPEQIKKHWWNRWNRK